MTKKILIIEDDQEINKIIPSFAYKTWIDPPFCLFGIRRNPFTSTANLRFSITRLDASRNKW